MFESVNTQTDAQTHRRTDGRRLDRYTISSPKNANNNYVFEDKWFLSKMFSQIKMQAATNWPSHHKKHQTFDFFQTTDF